MNYYKSARHKIHTALSLSREDWGILLRAWVWLLRINITLRRQPFTRVQEFVAGKIKDLPRPAPSTAWEIIRRHQRMVALAARYHLPRMTCLRQALTLQILLGGQGIPTELRLGGRKEAGQFTAHAWLEYEGQAVEISHLHERYKPFQKLGRGD